MRDMKSAPSFLLNQQVNRKVWDRHRMLAERTMRRQSRWWRMWVKIKPAARILGYTIVWIMILATAWLCMFL